MNDVLLFTGDCNGIIDMHFILLVYKYEYIMNKSSYFIDVYLCGIFLKYQKHLIYVVLFSVFFFSAIGLVNHSMALWPFLSVQPF